MVEEDHVMTKVEIDFWQDQITGLNDESLSVLAGHWFGEKPTEWVLAMQNLINADWQARTKMGLAA